jgi:hypothetical protein
MIRTNEKRETLIAFKKINVETEYLWDDHGKMINWNDDTDLPTKFTDVKARIDRYAFTERTSLIRKKDFEIQQLIINDEYLPGDVVEVEASFDESLKMTLHCKIVVGAG